MWNYQRVPYLYLYNFRETSMTGAKDMWEIVEPWAEKQGPVVVSFLYFKLFTLFWWPYL